MSCVDLQALVEVIERENVRIAASDNLAAELDAIRAKLERVMAASWDRLDRPDTSDLASAITELADLAKHLRPDASLLATCDRCGKRIQQGPYCKACLRDFDDERLEHEWRWVGP